MTPKQQRFVEEYCVDLNAAAAARRAGYSEATAKEIGCENLTKPHIIAAIEQTKAQLAEKAEISQQWVIDRLKETAEQAKGLDQPSAANRSYELIGKHIGMFTERHEIDLNDNRETVTDKELLAIVDASRGGGRASAEEDGEEGLPNVH